MLQWAAEKVKVGVLQDTSRLQQTSVKLLIF